MNKEEAEQRAQELLDYYGSGKHTGYEGITMPDGSPGVRVTGFVPTVTNMAIDQQKWERDHHFRGFADLVLADLKAIAENALRDLPNYSQEAVLQAQRQLITQRAYDLTEYVIRLVPHLVQAFPDLRTAEEVVSQIPDMTERPEQQRNV